MQTKTTPSAGADFVRPGPSGYRMFSDAELEQLHYATLEILRRTGVRVLEAESLDLLKGAGCIVSDENLVRFPAHVIEDALKAAPSRVVLCKQTGEPGMYLEGHRTYFGTGSDLPNTRDLDSGERRLSTLADVERTARLADALPNLDFVMSMALPSDVPIATSDRRSFRAMLQNTTKPLVFTAWDDQGLADIIAMAEAVANGPDELSLKPFLLAYLEPTSPLQHSEVVLRKVLMMADHKLPFVYAPGPIDGGSAPVTQAGALAMSNAESLSGLAIAQLRQPGTPFVLGAGSGPLDMRTMVATYSSPEFMLHCMGMAELAHYYYNLPVWGFSGCSDSKLPDTQAGIESALWILWTALSGANLVHDIGYIESGLTCSYEMIVINDEVIGFVRRLLEGIRITPETLALDTIHEVGPGGDYLSHSHTNAHFREVWYPRLIDRRNFSKWDSSGQLSMVERARALVHKILDSHTLSPLDPHVAAEIDAIIAAADQRNGIELKD